MLSPRRYFANFSALVFATIALAATPALLAQNTSTEPAALLARAASVMRVDRVSATSLLHFHAFSASEQNFQSDRMYPPFFSAMESEEIWYAPEESLERSSKLTTYPGSGTSPAQVSLSNPSRAYMLVGERSVPLPTTSLQTRYLNPWIVVSEWAADAVNVGMGGTETYRDYPRTVLVRKTRNGVQNLLLDSKTGFPVKFEFTEPHYLWGQRHVEYVYTTWLLGGGVMLPGASFRLADGKTEIARTISDADVLARSAAPAMTFPADPGTPAEALPRFLQPLDPQVIQVGPKTYLFKNPGYAEAVTEIGDEVFLFDATQGDERAKKDAALIAKLFPEHKKVTLVVTDIAWPHIAGVRYWVANGSAVIAHSAAREFLQGVIDRHWTLAPDVLEQHRATARLNFVPVNSVLQLAGGKITLHPIDGIGSEVALMAYLAEDKFLWASDFIQTLDGPASYTTEVWRATQRENIHPDRVAAEHLPLTPWAKIAELAAQDEHPSSPK